MSKIPLMPADTYTVINKTILHNSDRKILIMLYQPIIGANAINLYLTLWSYLDKSEIVSLDWTHHHIMSSMQMNLEKIIEAREKLEAIGLLKTYFKEDKVKNINDYVYQIYSPLKVSEFMADPILSTILFSSVGEVEYKKLIEYFKMPKFSLKSYKDISSSFSDVFIIENVININNIDEIKKENRLGIAFEPTIDLNNILSMIPQEILNVRTVNNKIKELLYKLALVYNYNDDIMKDLIINSIDDGHRIDIELLKNNARKYYRFENNNNLPGIVYRNQPEYLRSKITSTSKKAKMIYTFETTSPYDYLSNKNGCSLTKAETDILKYLLVDANMKPGVVNVLLDYVLKISDNKLVKQFVENKATEWKRNNIETVEDAMAQAKKERTTKKVATIKKEVVTPEWFNQNVDEEKASLEEQQAFLNRLKSME